MPDTNPLLDEINGLSPGAKAALMQAHQQSPNPAIAAARQQGQPIQPPPAPTGMQAPSQIQQPAQIGAPPPRVSLAPQPKGTLMGDQQALQQEANKKPALESVYSGITNSGFGQNHPVLGKVLGALGQIPATAADVASSAIIPRIGALTPGTSVNHGLKLQGLENRIGQEEKNQGEEATTRATNAEVPLRQAQTEHEQASTFSLQHPQIPQKEEAWEIAKDYAGPNGEPVEVEKNSGQLRVAGSGTPGVKRVEKEPKESTPQSQTYDSLIKSGMSPIQAYEKIREKPGGTTINQGTWQLDEDQDGKPVLFNSKTGETKAAPAGIAKAGTKAKVDAAEEKRFGPGRDALAYAHDYMEKPHTGPGDEALMEKFFELAKPSSGFRMSQPQIDMLKNARGWMSGVEGHLRHATMGTWFSDEQRQQIIDTMENLNNAKQPPNGQIAKPSAGNDPLGVL